MKDEKKGSDIPETMSNGNGDGNTPSKKTGLLARGRAKADQWQNLGVATEFTIIPIRKPKPDEYYRVMDGEDYTAQVNIIELKTEGEWYLVDEDVLPEIQLEKTLKLMQIFVCVTFDSAPFINLVPLPDATGKLNPWHESAHETMQIAKKHWVRRQPLTGQGYIVTKAQNNKLPDPKWPTLTLDEMVTKAFGRYYIDTPDHPVLLRLAGMRMS